MGNATPRIRAAICVGLASIVLAIGWLDYVTGPELGVSLFYLVPVTISGWWVGARIGAAMRSCRGFGAGTAGCA